MTIRCRSTSTLVPDNDPAGPVPPNRLPSSLWVILDAFNPADRPATLEPLMQFTWKADMSAVNTHPPCPCINRPTQGCRGQGATYYFITMADGSLQGPFPFYDYDGKTELIEEQINANYVYTASFDPDLWENNGSSDEFPVGWSNAFPKGGLVLINGHPFFAPTEHKGTGSMTNIAQENLRMRMAVPDTRAFDFYVNGARFGSFSVNDPERVPGFVHSADPIPYTPAVTSGTTGQPFPDASAQGWWQRNGRMIHVSVLLGVGVSNGAGLPQFSLPVPPSPRAAGFNGQETQKTGVMWLAPLFPVGHPSAPANRSIVTLRDYNNGGGIIDGMQWLIWGDYEAA